MVPKLRFKEFCGEWEEKRLGDIAEIYKGNTLSKSDLRDEGAPCILYGELYTKYGEIIKRVYNKTNRTDKNLFRGKNNDVLIPSSGETAIDISTASCLKCDNVYIGGDLNVIRCNDINGSFLSYNLNHKQKNSIAKFAQGVSVVHLYGDSLRKLKIKIPSLPEQTKIADFLSTVDDKIQNQQDKITHLENIKKGFLQKIFSRKIRFKDDGGDEFPEWEEKKLGDIADLLSSKRIYLDDYVEKGVPFFRGKEISELKNNKKIEDLIFITKEKYNEIKEKYGVPQKNDLLITAVGTLGNTLIIQDENPFYFKDGNLIWLKNISQNVVFLDFLLNSQNGKKLILNSAIGSTQKALTIIELNKLKFKFPCLKEQKKIANFLSSFDEKISTEKDTLENLRQLKKGLLQQIFV